jgi:hypothetical protein
MRKAWAKAVALKSEKSVGCTMERMECIAISHTRRRGHKQSRVFPPPCVLFKYRRELPHGQ